MISTKGGQNVETTTGERKIKNAGIIHLYLERNTNRTVPGNPIQEREENRETEIIPNETRSFTSILETLTQKEKSKAGRQHQPNTQLILQKPEQSSIHPKTK